MKRDKWGWREKRGVGESKEGMERKEGLKGEKISCREKKGVGKRKEGSKKELRRLRWSRGVGERSSF